MNAKANISRVLIIDDEPDLCELLEITLSRMGINAESVYDVPQGIVALKKSSFDLCLTDMRMPGGSGIDIVRYIEEHCPNTPVAVITAHGSIEDAVEAMRLGAFDFVSKPVDLTILRRLIESALKRHSLNPQPKISTDNHERLLGSSHLMQDLRAMIHKLARSQAPVYIHGESGVGKELVAREIHLQSSRQEGPFIAVNCGAIPSELVESEFFGHIKGSFTGASHDKQGLFVAANNGTLFLDEVADLPLAMQVKLLRVIQERAVKPIGASIEQATNVRIVSATHKDLAEEVAQERFRQDLFYRLNVIELVVPPLRERAEDIPQLADAFLQQIAKQWGAERKQLTPSAQTCLQSYHYPGNVRELVNILERAVTFADGDVIESHNLSLEKSGGHKKASAPSATAESDNLLTDLESTEKTAIYAALESTHWNKTAAARQLGMTLRQLRYRLSKYESASNKLTA